MVFNEPKRVHVTSLFISLHWLYQLRLASSSRCLHIEQPVLHPPLLRVYISSRSLRSVNEQRLMVPLLGDTKSLSRTFSYTVPSWWNDLPNPLSERNRSEETAEDSSLLSQLHPAEKKKKFPYDFTFPQCLPVLACTILNNAMKLCIAYLHCSC